MALNLRNVRDRSRDEDDVDVETAASAAVVPETTVAPSPASEATVRLLPLEDLLPYVVKGLAPRGEDAENDVIVHLLGRDALSRSRDEVRNELTIEILSKAPDLGTADESTLNEANRDAWIAQHVARFGQSIPLAGATIAPAAAAVVAAEPPVVAAAVGTAPGKLGKLNLRALADKADAADDETPLEAAAAASEGVVVPPKAEEDEYAAALKDVIVPSPPPSIHDPIQPRRPAAAASSAAQSGRDPQATANAGSASSTGTDPYSEAVASIDPADRALLNEQASAERAKKLGLVDPTAARETEREAMASGPRQPGNAIDSLLSVAMAPIVGVAQGLAFGARKFREILSDRTGAGERGFSADAVRDRIFDAKMDELRNDAVGIVEAGEALGRDVESFNEAFLASSAATKLKKVADAEGKTVSQLLTELSSGKGKPEHLALARDAMAEPAVKTAWDKVEPALGKMDARARAARQGLETLSGNFPDRFDPEAESKGLEAAQNAANSKVPEPAFEDPDAGEKLRDKLKKLAERMVEWAKEFIAKLIQKFTSAVKPG